MLKRMSWAMVVVALLGAAVGGARGQVMESPQARGGRGGGGLLAAGVIRATVVPHWLEGNEKFWYRNDLRGGAREFILVDAAVGTRAKAFDHLKLAKALADAAGDAVDGDKLPFETIEFVDGVKGVKFAYKGKTWMCSLADYGVKAAGAAESAPATRERAGVEEVAEERIFAEAPQATGTQPATTRAAGRGRGRGRGAATMASPDGRLALTVRNNNLVVIENGEEKPLTTDGTAAFGYARPYWSPDGKYVVAFKMEPGEQKEVYRLESSPVVQGAKGGGTGRAVLQRQAYALPGDKFDSYEVHCIEVATGKNLKPELERIDMDPGGWDPSPIVRWLPDGRHFMYEKFDRGHQRVRIIEVDVATGTSRNILDEQSKTFIWTAHAEAVNGRIITYLKNPNEILYMSEMDGWRHFYMVDAKAGALKQITKGQWVVRGIDYIDEDARELWFSASGTIAGQDPYLIHHGRVKFDGTGLTWLTEGDGSHTLAFQGTNSSFSPDFKYFIDSYSRVDLPPVTELRRASDGKLVVALEKAEPAPGWDVPAVFSAKGRDGETDIWGIVFPPTNFDPAKKYAVIEDIYAGPQDSFVPKTFSPAARYRELRDLGFFVVKVDGMGTANRSKAFHDVIWENIKDAGFLDRIAWMKAAAKKWPAMDLDRVGIYGTSAGGQNAAAAVLFHPEFYKVAVANCGCHDNRMDKASWNEQWMGYPVGPQYGENSNIDNAAKLKGRLQLVVGELDSNVPPESTYRLVDALIKAGKDFEFVLVPGANHGTRGSPTQSAFTGAKLRDFFVKYLQGTEPPNRNGER